jgi:hypothetical protein
MVYAELAAALAKSGLHFGLKTGPRKSLDGRNHVANREITGNDARPLVKVYTKRRLRDLFNDFTGIEIVQRQLAPELVPITLRRFLPVVERLAGWNLIIKARKAQRS